MPARATKATQSVQLTPPAPIVNTSSVARNGLVSVDASNGRRMINKLIYIRKVENDHEQKEV